MKIPEPVVAPSLDTLAEDPARIQSLPAPLQADLYRRAARLEAELRAALLAALHQHQQRDHQGQQDEVLTLREAAVLLRTSKDTLHRKWRRLPFAYLDPLDRKVKFRRRGLERYLADRQVRGNTS